MLCVTRKRFAAGAERRARSARSRLRDRARGVVVAGVESGADRRRAEIQLLQLRPTHARHRRRRARCRRRSRRTPGRASSAPRPADACVRPSGRRRTRRPCGASDAASARAASTSAPCAEQQRQARRRREHVVGRLSHVDVIVRMDQRGTRRARRRAARRRGWRAPRWRSCCATCRRRPGRRRRRTDRGARRRGSRRRPATMASPMRASSRPSATLACAAAFLTRTVAVTRSAGARRPLIGKFSSARAVWMP